MTTNHPYRADNDPNRDADDKQKSDHKPKITRIVPEPLRWWQVAGEEEDLTDEWEAIWADASGPLELEGRTLEGEATVVDTQTAHEAQPSTPNRPTQHASESPNLARPPIADHHDSIIVAGLDNNHLLVNPGMAATFHVRVLNNGRKRATFGAHVEGWIDERWITVYPVNTQLQPGEQTTLTVAIAPPRLPSSPAGDHAVAIIVRSSDYPDRLSRLGATLTIKAFDEVALGEIQPRRTRVGWHRQTAAVHLPISNQGNRPLTLRVQGRTNQPACRFEFVHPQSGVRQSGECLLNLPPGKSANVAIRITPDSLPLFSLHPRSTPYQISVTVVGQQRTPREVGGQLMGRPLIGGWQLLAAGTLATTALLMLALIGLGGLFTVQYATRVARPGPTNEPAVVAIMLNMQQPAPVGPGGPIDAAMSKSVAIPPTSDPPRPETTGQIESNQVAVASLPGVSEGNAPIVQPNQVTAPGAGQSPSAPAISAPPAQADAGMTYSAMFQEIGGRYDLDWRLLAAQAYLESNFNSVALGQSGDLGLMQILPGTWREWAPTVGATDPFDSYGNVMVAAAYLNYLRDMFSQRGQVEPKWMLVAYNWGPDKLLTFLNSGQQWEDLDPSLRQYAEDILGIAAGIPLE